MRTSTRSSLFAFLKLGVLQASPPRLDPGQGLGGDAICLWCYGLRFLNVKPPETALLWAQAQLAAGALQPNETFMEILLTTFPPDF